MKRFYLFFVLILCLAGVQAQRFVQYSTDSSRIKYASFLESENRDMSPDSQIENRKSKKFFFAQPIDLFHNFAIQYKH
jgi:hypothetical protein